MTQEHPITPPPELILEWCQGWNCSAELIALGGVATQAAHWGWEQRDSNVANEIQEARHEELEACCEVLENDLSCFVANDLRAARRPKPPSLKEQALQALYRFDDMEGHETQEQIAEDFVIIRRAIESLPD